MFLSYYKKRKLKKKKTFWNPEIHCYSCVMLTKKKRNYMYLKLRRKKNFFSDILNNKIR